MKTNTRTPARHVTTSRGESRNPVSIYANQTAIRAAFWEAHPQFKRRGAKVRQNSYPCDVRTAFVDFVDSLEKSGDLSIGLAERVTL